MLFTSTGTLKLHTVMFIGCCCTCDENWYILGVYCPAVLRILIQPVYVFTGVGGTSQRRGSMKGYGGGAGGGGGGGGKAGDAGFIHKPVLNLESVNNIDKVGKK